MIKPIGEYVLLSMEGFNNKEGGIFLPEPKQINPYIGTVVNLGIGAFDDNENKVPFKVAVGDKVIVDNTSVNKIRITLKEGKFWIYHQIDIIAKIED